jgi:8-oxo-dGTP pyrophosphatase MutT (NUDIX family)
MTARRYEGEPLPVGTWNDGATEWQFRLSEREPNPKLCSAIGLVAIMSLKLDEVVLVLNKDKDRGWGMIAGGVDPGETPPEAREREALEEGGFVVARPQLYGYREITNHVLSEKDIRKGRQKHGFMPYYYAFTDEPLREPTGDDISKREVFSMNDPQAETMLDPVEIRLIWEGLRAAKRAR